jgi:LuxR family maltose regulon positive regulatory protein
LPQEAVDYALAAADFSYAAQLIAGPAMATMQRGEVNTLLRWYEAFPSGFVAAQPALALQFGLAFALNGRWSEAEALLQTIEQTDDTLPSTALMLAYLVASQAGDTERLTAVANQAAAHPQPDSLTTLVLGLVVGLTGDWARACQLMTEAQERSTREGDHTLALTALFHRCRLHVFGGELLAAYDACQQALQQVEAAGSALLPMTTFAHVSLGRIMIEWQQMDSAAEHLAQAIHGAEQSGFVTGILSSATMMLAEAKQAQGDTTAATQLAEQALAYAARYDPAAEVAWLRIYQVRLWLGQGKGVTAVNWLHTTREQYLPPSRFYIDQIRPITQARVLLAQHKYEEAIPLLTSLTTAPRHLLTVELFALLALARQAQGDSHHALLALTQALELAQTEKHQHVFMELGPAMTKLLTRFCEELAEHTAVAFARELLRIAAVQPLLTQAIDPLSQREREVLQLIVAGYSNQEIAETLTIASSTVKWYINTLYSKLQVKSRSQAIARSRELGLFTD